MEAESAVLKNIEDSVSTENANIPVCSHRLSGSEVTFKILSKLSKCYGQVLKATKTCQRYIHSFIQAFLVVDEISIGSFCEERSR